MRLVLIKKICSTAVLQAFAEKKKNSKLSSFCVLLKDAQHENHLVLTCHHENNQPAARRTKYTVTRLT